MGRWVFITLSISIPWIQVSRLKARQHLFTDKALWEISRLLKILLTRLSKEIRRFSQKFNICTRNEVYSATQVIFSKTVSRACIGSAYQAYYLYLNSTKKSSDRHLRVSKSERAGLTVSVGKIFRWMLRNRIAPHVTDSAAVYLTAVLEYLVDEICYLSDKTVSEYLNIVCFFQDQTLLNPCSTRFDHFSNRKLFQWLSYLPWKQSISFDVGKLCQIMRRTLGITRSTSSSITPTN